MQRLTFDGNFCDIAWCKATPEECPHEFCSQRQTWERLKMIEDALGDEYDVEQLRKMAHAEKEGRIAVTPLQNGTQVFVSLGKLVLPFTVTCVSFTDGNRPIYVSEHGRTLAYRFFESDIGRTVFFDFKDAQKKAHKEE